MPPPLALFEEGSTDTSMPSPIISPSTPAGTIIRQGESPFTPATVEGDPAGHGGGLASGLMDSGGSRPPAVLNVKDVLVLAWSYVHANAQKSPRRTAVLPPSLATVLSHPLSRKDLS